MTDSMHLSILFRSKSVSELRFNNCFNFSKEAATYMVKAANVLTREFIVPSQFYRECY